MKNNVFTFPILALAFVALFFTSCKKDEPIVEEKVETMAEKMVGTWNVTAVSFDGQSMMDWFQTMNIEIGNSTSKTIDFNVTDLDGILETTEGTYTLNDDETILTVDMDGDIIDYTLVMVDNEITLTATDDGEVLIYVATK